ncbi:prefoldin subunit alpha [Candidatus Woesearchaeota archaeon]|nr:prefoldin subunit alpha [Candidatus Woesearchaeota archaeon]
MEQKEIEKRVLEYQMLEQRMRDMQEQLMAADQQLIDMVSTARSIEEIASIDDKKDMLVPITNGIFTTASLRKSDTLLVNIGSSVVVEMSMDETKKLIEKQREELKMLRTNISENLKKFMKRASEIEKELKDII